MTASGLQAVNMVVLLHAAGADEMLTRICK
jgi:hypothetical protein